MLHVLVIFALSHKIQERGGGVVQIYFTLTLMESRQIQTQVKIVVGPKLKFTSTEWIPSFSF